MNNKLPHWIILSETEAHELIGLFHRIGCNTATHYINDERQIYGFDPPTHASITFYCHKIHGETDGYTGTMPHKVYHIQRRILKHYFNLLYLVHILSPGLAEQQLVMGSIKELMNEECDNVHKEG